MRGLVAKLRSVCWSLISRADRFMNRLYSSRFNPLYHSGALVVLLLVVLLLTGLYLLIFYRIGEPHASVARITASTRLWRQPYTLSNLDLVTLSLTLMAGKRSLPSSRRS